MYLGGVDADLTMGHIGHLHIIENLDISLSHLHTDVVACLLQILCGSVEVQLVKFDGVRYLETRKERHTGTQTERRVVGVAVGVGTVDGLCTSKVETLTSREGGIGQTTVAGGRQLCGALALDIGLLVDADIVGYSMLSALAQ